MSKRDWRPINKAINDVQMGAIDAVEFRIEDDDQQPISIFITSQRMAGVIDLALSTVKEGR